MDVNKLPNSIDELKKIIIDQQKTILELQAIILDLQAIILDLKSRLNKNSDTSSKPPSMDYPKKESISINKNRSLREKSGKKSGGQKGHIGKTRSITNTPDEIVNCQTQECSNCGSCLIDTIGKTTAKEQIIDIAQIKSTITQYNEITKECPNCKTKNKGILPNGQSNIIRIGENIKSFVVYLNIKHHLPYKRLKMILNDILNISISEGTIDKILAKASKNGFSISKKIKNLVNTTEYRGSDETGVRINGKNNWEWVWQNEKATYYAINKSRGFATVEKEMPEEYQGVHVADCWNAQNNTKSTEHQLCHEHIKRDFKNLIEMEKSPFAYKFYRFFCRSHKARDILWKMSEEIREKGILWHKRELEKLLLMPTRTKKEKTLQKRIIKHKDKILTFMRYKNVPPNNNTSEQAIRQSKIKMKISGGFRSQSGADNYAILLSIIETCRKQKMDVLESIRELLQGIDISNQFISVR